QNIHTPLTMLLFFHTNELNHNDAAEIAQADLANNLVDGVDIRTDNRIFEPVRFAHEFARIDVDRNKRFRLIDHNVAARFQPYLRAQRLLDLKIQSILFEYLRVLQMQLDAVHKRRLELVDEIEDRREFGFIIQAICS